MRRSILAVALTAVLAVAGCGGSASATAGATATTADSAGDQFGGDICSALTTADIEGATYGQGAAKAAGTDTQKDPDTGKAVVCQYLATFGDNPSIVVVTVSLLSDDEYATHDTASIVSPAEAVAGIGSEAFLVAPAPGLLEVWVTGPHGKFKLGAQFEGDRHRARVGCRRSGLASGPRRACAAGPGPRRLLGGAWLTPAQRPDQPRPGPARRAGSPGPAWRRPGGPAHPARRGGGPANLARCHIVKARLLVAPLVTDHALDD